MMLPADIPGFSIEHSLSFVEAQLNRVSYAGGRESPWRKSMNRYRAIVIVLVMCSFPASGNVLTQSSDQQKPDQKKQYPNLPSETPDKLTPTNDGFD